MMGTDSDTANVDENAENAVADLAKDIDAVGWTAFGVAWARAKESQRADRWFDDPLAAEFMSTVAPVAPFPVALDSDDGDDQPDVTRFLRLFGEYLPVRTRFFDEYFREAGAVGCRQVVILAAGLDARAFRLDWPTGTRLFEVDVPAVLAFKRRVIDASGLAPTCERVTVEADLRTDWLPVLRAAGLDTEQPTAWLAEGLLPYLGDEASQRLLRALATASPAGSRLAIEHAERDLRDLPMFKLAAVGIDADPVNLWPGGLVEEPTGWLEGEGWQAKAHDPAELAVEYGRPTPRILDAAHGGGPFATLVSASR
jgi:methyltransferase (TIGR00027 family)